MECLHEDGNLDRYLAWLRDPLVLRYLEARFHEHSLESLRQYIKQCNAATNVLLLGIRLKDGGQHIGNIKLGPIDRHHRRADIGLIIGERSQWGRGYATEAILCVARYAFDVLKLRKVVAGCYAENTASSRAFERANFLVEARLPEHWMVGNTVQDGVLLGLTSSRFHRLAGLTLSSESE